MFLLGLLTNQSNTSLRSARAAAIGLLAFALCAGAASSACGQTTATFTVSSNTDDAGQDASGGVMRVSDSIGYMGSYVGLRFQNVTIPAGATIISATLDIYANGSGTTSFSVDIAAQDADSTSAFTTSGYNITNRPLTTATTPWVIGSTSFTDGVAFSSPNFASSIQEVVDRPGWVSGNSLVVITTPVSGNKGIWQRDGNTAFAPRLNITYTTEDTLVAHFKLDETSGTTAVDSSTYGNDGSLVGSPTWVPDTPQTRGLQFGSGDRVDAGNFAVSGSALTLTAWFYVETPSNDGRIVIRSDGNSQNDQSWGLAVDENGNLDFRVHAGGTWNRVEADEVIQPERWYHAVGVYDGTTMSLYLDGQLIETKTHPVGGTIDDDPSYTVTLGDSVIGGRPFVGRLDDVRVYKQTLNAAEVAELYGLVGHWKFDETAGTTAADSSGLGNDGTYQSGTTLARTGVYDQAAEFNGSSGHVLVPGASSLNLQGSVTAACWAKSDTGTWNATGMLMSKRDQFTLYPTSGNTTLYFFVRATSGWQGASLDLSTLPGFSLTDWHHYTGVYEQSSGQIRLYIDGELQATVAIGAGTALAFDTGNLTIGKEEISANYFDGVMDDARLYNRALSVDEISRIAGKEFFGHWKLTETSGTTVVDSGSSGLDGTYENGVALDQGGPYPGVTAPAFDGSNDHVELPEIDANFGNGMTIAAWIQPDATLGSGQFHEILDLSNGSQVDQILLSYNGSAGLQLFLTDTVDGSSIRTIEDNKGFTADRWVHCVATIDASGNATLYRNGQVTKSGFFTSLPTSVARSTATIGKSSFGDHFGGGLQDVRLYNYELTAAQINEIYGLVGKWDFDEGSGTTAAESSGVASDATFNTGTPAWIDGVRGKALEFDGTNDAQTDETIEPPATGAVAFWMRSDGPPSSRQRPWGIGGDYEVWQDTDGLMSMDVSTDGYQGGFITTTSLDSKDRWYHVVAQYNSDTDAYEIYLDGQLHKSGVSTTSIQQQAANNLSFGTRTGSTQRFSGALDDFRLYNRWLNPAEIAEIYGLVGWWRMEETSGSVVADSSGTGNHGTVVGTSDWSTDTKEASGSIELDGTNYVEIPGLLVDGPSATVSGWAQLTAADTNGAELISVGNHLAIRLDDGYYGSTAFAYGGGGFTFSSPGITHENTGWHHFTASFDELTQEVKLYIDGVLRSTETAAGTLTMTGLDSTIRFGTHTGSETDRSFTGLLDDIRVYNRAITPSEVRTLYFGEEVFGPRIVKWVEVANP